MSSWTSHRACAVALATLVVLPASIAASQGQAAATAPPTRTEPHSTLRAPSRANLLRGEYGRYRANNDLLHYLLDVRVDPAAKSIRGTNTIRFRMLQDDTRIQLELYANLQVDGMSVQTDMLSPSRLTRVSVGDVESTRLSNVSPMPAGLLDTFKDDEILDLLAYILSRGDRKHAMFKK